MSHWSDPERWNALRSEEGCPVCREGVPGDALAHLETSWVAMPERAPVRGYACLILRRHAVELHDLGEAEGAALMRDVRRVSRALADATGAVKMNYEIHGNTIPHLHVHFFPRYVGDPFEGAPINPRAITWPVYVPGEFEALRRRVLEGLGSSRVVESRA